MEEEVEVGEEEVVLQQLMRETCNAQPELVMYRHDEGLLKKEHF